MDAVRLKNIVFFAHHGVNADEIERGQRFEIDLELRGDLSRAGRSDNLKDAYDYNELYNLVWRAMFKRHYNLIETLAEAIAEAILDEYPEIEVVVVARKPGAPLPGLVGFAEVEITRKRIGGK